MRIVPQLVRDDPSSLQSVSYNDMLAVLVLAYKEQTAEAERLESSLKEQEEIIELLQGLLEPVFDDIDSLVNE